MKNLTINENLLRGNNFNLNEEEVIKNPHMRVVDYLKKRNANNMDTVASEYFNNQFTFEEMFKMIDDYKKAFISLEGNQESQITLSSPSVVSSVNAFYGAIDANKIVASFGPGFLQAFPDKYFKEMDSKTLVVFDTFLNEDFIRKIAASGVKNVIITSVADYMHPMVKEYAIKSGMIPKEDFLDRYVKSGKKLPNGVQFIRLEEFAKVGASIKEDTKFSYDENKIAARFLTGATTSQIPKCVNVYADGLVKMGEIYDNTWFDFKAGERNTVFIPIFYATGAVHGVHAGFIKGLTNIYKPVYNRFAFANDLKETKCNLTIVAPSHVSTLAEADLKDNELNHLKYIFIGGEAVTPDQMKKYRDTAKRLGIKYIIDGYGMTETASMTGISDKYATDSDVTITPVPGVKYRIVDPDTREEVPNNVRGILEKWSPCNMAGYTEEEKNKQVFTKDGWINTGDVAIKYDNGHYRVFGRANDYFENNGQKYAMFDIEEEMLKHEGILEAEVIKFKENNQEYPAIVLVLKQEYKERIPEILDYIAKINFSGKEYLIGTRFIDKFKTNPVTAKRDYLSLINDKNGYYLLKDNQFYETDILDNEFLRYPISNKELTIFTEEKDKVLVK